MTSKLPLAGKMIVIEGCDGAGKTTATKYVEEYLVSKGYKVHCAREPGGTPLAEKFREIIVDGHPDEQLTDAAELLAFTGARMQNCELIRKRMDEGYVVLCDRYTLSTIVYQHMSRGVDAEIVFPLIKMAHDKLTPDIVLFLDVPLDVCLSHIEQQNDGCRIGTNTEFIREVHANYRAGISLFESMTEVEVDVVYPQGDIESLSQTMAIYVDFIEESYS